MRALHEMSLVESLLESLEMVVREQGVTGVREVGLRVGALRQVEPEVMAFCFSVATRGTFLEGAELRVILQPLRRRCLTCGHRWEGALQEAACPRCGSVSERTGGFELDLEYIEVKEDESTHYPEP
ncbi:hydrogenase expression/synthesis HypA [Aminomonas paucivorans DSM 12260]|uniref:Hydrogenase maturation factor HypA n=2 Tax=Aminomonas TaxID=81411 RepID=E3CXY3_9BACT|nr:hydrogenase expression/synthesis HypA [Aminomonas paucivorans DSM 12260]